MHVCILAGEFTISPETAVLDCTTATTHFDLVIANNSIYQDDRVFTFDLRVSNTPTGVTLVDSVVILTILDDDS